MPELRFEELISIELFSPGGKSIQWGEVGGIWAEAWRPASQEDSLGHNQQSLSGEGNARHHIIWPLIIFHAVLGSWDLPCRSRGFSI